ncbi:MAG: TerB family tellurite resistance protein [Anaerolineales bacterium]|nr:TerB family tellurite resistance protein [Anaerolineales bacterium]
MDSHGLILTLGKVVIAAAWADGRVSDEEIDSVRDLLFYLPQVGQEQGVRLNEQDWQLLELYMLTPVGEEERQRLVVELQGVLRHPADKALAVRAIENMIMADGVVTPEETAVFQEIRNAIESVELNFFSQFSWLVSEAVRRRIAAVAHAPNREQYFDDFIKNRVYYAVCQRLNMEETQLDMPEQELRKLSLAGGLLAKVAHTDRKVDEREYEAVVQALENFWGVDRKTAVFVTEVSLMAVTAALDPYRMMRQFTQATNREERVRFLDILFAVAAADGCVGYEEMEQIRLLAQGLNLTHPEFVNAKLQIPRAQRAN